MNFLKKMFLFSILFLGFVNQVKGDGVIFFNQDYKGGAWKYEIKGADLELCKKYMNTVNDFLEGLEEDEEEEPESLPIGLPKQVGRKAILRIIDLLKVFDSTHEKGKIKESLAKYKKQDLIEFAWGVHCLQIIGFEDILVNLVVGFSEDKIDFLSQFPFYAIRKILKARFKRNGSFTDTDSIIDPKDKWLTFLREDLLNSEEKKKAGLALIGIRESLREHYKRKLKQKNADYAFEHTHEKDFDQWFWSLRGDDPFDALRGIQNRARYELLSKDSGQDFYEKCPEGLLKKYLEIASKGWLCSDLRVKKEIGLLNGPAEEGSLYIDGGNYNVYELLVLFEHYKKITFIEADGSNQAFLHNAFLSVLKRMGKLKEINFLKNVFLGPWQVKDLNRQLESITFVFHSSNQRVFDYNDFQGFDNLKKLFFCECSVNNISKLLMTLPGLEELAIKYFDAPNLNFENDSFERHGLKRLVLMGCYGITEMPPGIEKLADLEYLCLSNSGISYEDIDLRNMKNLQTLHLQDDDLEDEDVQSLRDRLPEGCKVCTCDEDFTGFVCDGDCQ